MKDTIMLMPCLSCNVSNSCKKDELEGEEWECPLYLSWKESL
jgi:hypothetical protein